MWGGSGGRVAKVRFYALLKPTLRTVGAVTVVERVMVTKTTPRPPTPEAMGLVVEVELEIPDEYFLPLKVRGVAPSREVTEMVDVTMRMLAEMEEMEESE